MKTKEECKSLLIFRSNLFSLEDSDTMLQVFEDFYNDDVPSEFGPILTDFYGTCSPFKTTIVENVFNEWVVRDKTNIMNFYQLSEHLNISLKEAYRKYAPLLLRRKLYTILPSVDSFSSNISGNIRLVAYDIFKEDVDKMMKHYHYALESEEPYKEKNNRKTTILKYKLNLD